MVLDDRIGNAGLGAQVAASHFRDQLFFGVHGKAELGSFGDALARQSLCVSRAVSVMLVGIMPIMPTSGLCRVLHADQSCSSGAGLRCRHNQSPINRGKKGGFVGFRWFTESADLSHELERCRADFIVGNRRLEIEKDLDVPAHEQNLGALYGMTSFLERLIGKRPEIVHDPHRHGRFNHPLGE